MNIERVFNYPSEEVIRVAMIGHGVSTAIAEWTCHILGNRKSTTNKGNASICGTVASRCSQREILLAVLWCLVADELLHQLTSWDTML